MDTEQVKANLIMAQAEASGPKAKKPKPLPITILMLGGSMFGGLAVSEWWFREVTGVGDIFVSEKKTSRKGYCLIKMAARREMIVMAGHSRQFSEMDVAKQVARATTSAGFTTFSCVMDGTSRIASADGEQAMLAHITETVLAHTFKGSPVYYVDVKSGDGVGDRAKHNCSEAIMAALAKSYKLPEVHTWTLAAPAPTAPARKELLTPAMKERLMNNKTQTPLFKLFGGACTWLCVSLEDDGDTLWGWADIGQGIVEYGPFSLRDIETVRFRPLNNHAERDKFFDGKRVDVEHLGVRTSLAGI